MENCNKKFCEKCNKKKNNYCKCDLNNNNIITIMTSQDKDVCCHKQFVFIINTNNIINNNDFIGSVIVPFDCNIISLAFSINKCHIKQPYVATLYINNTASTLNSIILDGSINTKVITYWKLNIKCLDILSLCITFPNGTLNYGISSSVLVSY